MFGSRLIAKCIRRHVFEEGRRCVSRKVAVSIKPLEAFSKEENVEFMKHYPKIVEDLTTNVDYKNVSDFTERFTKALHYTVPNGKKVRGLTTIITYKMLEKPENLTVDNIRLVNILGWCVELLESSILIIDDILDGSDTRRNGPCWYKNPDVGKSAVLDAVILENSVYLLLKKYFSSHPFYVPIVELFSRTSFNTAMGQLLDGMTYDLEEITMERFNTITKYKTAYYTFHFPITLGMYFSKMFSEELHNQMKPVFLKMGQFFQIKNDYNDCFGDPNVTGKSGTDIQEGKCTWLSALALQKASAVQYEIMKEHFGKPSEKSVQSILTLYKELNLPKEMEEYEQQSFEDLCKVIKGIENVSVVNLLYTIVEKLYKRQRVLN